MTQERRHPITEICHAAWVIPVPEGAPQPWQKNASGLVRTSPPQVMFAEIKD